MNHRNNLSAVSIGDACIDNYIVPTNQRKVGGNAANTAVYLARGGIRASYVGAVGDDADGKLICDRLRAEGVDISHVHARHGITAITDILLENGERQFLREEFGVGVDFKLDDEDISFCAQHTLAHQSILGLQWEFLPALKERGARISFDFSSPRRYPESFLRETLPLVEIAFFSASHLHTADEKSAWARELQAQGPRIVVLTFGADGSLAFDGRDLYLQSAFPTTVVDTCGAGDSFIGSFLARYLHGDPPAACLAFASRVAADAITHVGAW